MPRSRLNQLLGEVDAAALLAEHDVTITGDADALRSMLDRLDDFGFWFDIVTP
jgi:alkyl sulfatase BDS1-like metallo-beta-lactamase superfamily hydrolase